MKIWSKCLAGLLAVMLVFAMTACGEEEKQTYYVKVYETFEFPGENETWESVAEFDENGNLTRYGSLERFYTFVYDENGMVKQAVPEESNGWLDGVDYCWDENGNLAEVIYTYATGVYGESHNRELYEYDEKKRLVKMTSYATEDGEDGMLQQQIYTYTDTGYSMELYYEEGVLFERYEMELSEQGVVLKNITYDANGTLVSALVPEYTYDAKGVPVSGTGTDTDGFVFEYVLDEHGHYASQTVYTPDGSLYQVSTNVYAPVKMIEAQHRAYRQIVKTLQSF